MQISAIGMSRLLVNYVYKWIFPATTTIAFLVFADQEKNTLIRIILWLLLCLAHLSIPLNFERPQKAVFHFFLDKKPLAIIIVIIQASVLGFGVYGLTILSLSLFFSLSAYIAQLRSITSGLLYLRNRFRLDVLQRPLGRPLS